MERVLNLLLLPAVLYSNIQHHLSFQEHSVIAQIGFHCLFFLCLLRHHDKIKSVDICWPYKKIIFVLPITEQAFSGSKAGKRNATLCHTGNVPLKPLLQYKEISSLSQQWCIHGNIHYHALYLLSQLIS